MATDMDTIAPLPPDALYRRCDPAQFTFATTAELETLEEILGQARAIEAVTFGIGMRRQGYNLFLLGPAGIGKHTLARQFLDRQAKAGPPPSDWCYINNFDGPGKPRALRLPAGTAVRLRADMERLVEELRSAVPSAFDSDDYRNRKQTIEQQFKERHEQSFAEIQKRAREKNIALIRTPGGIALGPTRDDEVLSAEEFRKLPEAEQERLKADMEDVQRQLQETLHLVPKWDKEQREKVRELNREVTRFAVGHLIDELRKNYGDLENVCDYLAAAEADIIENAQDFLAASGAEPPPGLPFLPPMESPSFTRYEVNVLIDNTALIGAPVVYEDHPTHPNLIGRVEHVAQFGALITDFTLIKPGALHRANGGYLILDALKVLTQPFAWEELKRVLRAGEIRVESLGQMLSLVSTVSLEPEPIPLDVKVVLLGERILYYLLIALDPEFNELFKVAADFEEDMQTTAEIVPLYARLIGTMAKSENLRPFDRGAVARVIEHSARLAGDAEKMSTHVLSVGDVLREADFWSSKNGHEAVTADDVESAIEAQIRRASRVRERIGEEIKRGAILIDTAGAVAGQVNGLSVLKLGQYAFGRPTRITARVRLGQGRVVDIEREVKLGGPIHSKGILILTGFLGARYAPDRPLSLSASLVFEQSYVEVEGDSASLAELAALLSALADVPIRQSLAVTGSVNQFGQVQAIGGVNEKIE
ncbi:MAG TPA: ATP-binding protein, partial [Alphaproteobacteria bacterium]|nr:ATP-binding protein [Alphaproteobacteria bacterium]